MTQRKQQTTKKQHKTKNKSFAVVERLSLLRRRVLVRLACLFLASYSVFVSFFFSNILKNDNYLEIFPRELLFPLLMHAVTAGIIVVFLYWLPWLKTYTAKLVATVSLAFLLVGYDAKLTAMSGIIKALTPGLNEGDSMVLASIVFFVLLVSIAAAIGVGISKLVDHMKGNRHIDVQLGVAALLGYLLVIPHLGLLHIIPALIKESTVVPSALSQKIHKQSDKPDIYYIVLDRYASNQTLASQFGFDNTPFTESLRSQGFTVNDNAHSNYPFTAMSIASTLNARYTNEIVAPFKNDSAQARVLYHNTVRQSSVVKTLKDAGYQYHSIGSVYGVSNQAPLADHDYMKSILLSVMGKIKNLRGVEALEFSNSPYYRFAKASMWPFKLSEETRVDTVQTQLQNLTKLANDSKPGGRFIFAHILVPHDPFDFNADGSLSLNNEGNNTGRPVRTKYTDQVEFINTQIQSVITSALSKSNGQAVMLLNSDEGPYPQTMDSSALSPVAEALNTETAGKGDDMTKWSDSWLQMKYGILQAAHIPLATEEDMHNLSSVNLFRIVLNRYADLALPYLPNCNYALTAGGTREYLYTDITNRLQQSTQVECQSYESKPSK